MSVMSTYLAYKLIGLLSKPFTDWEAFELGLIDEDGKSIKKLVTTEEKKAFGIFEKMARNIKSLITKITGKSRAAAVLSTLYLMKEKTMTDENAEVLLDYLIKEYPDIKEYVDELLKIEASKHIKFKDLCEGEK